MILPSSGWQRLLLALISGALLAVPFLAPHYYWLTWLAFVPLLMAIDQVSLKAAYGLGLASGLLFSMIAGYWITDFLVITKGYGVVSSLLLGSVFWFFCAQVTGILAVVFNGVKRWNRRMPQSRHFQVHEFVLFPLVVASAYGLIPMLFPFHPGDSQSRFLSALQAIEFTGLFGLDALIALVNIMIYRALTQWPKNSLAWIPWALASVIVAAWFTYGAVTARAWDEKLATWPTLSLGIVQPNESPSIGIPPPMPGYSLAHPPEMAMTLRLAQAGAELIVWPETRYKGYFDNPHVQSAYSAQLAEAGVMLLFQDSERVTELKPGQSPADADQYNSAVLIDSDGSEHGHYRKMKTMPFGESVPLSNTFPFLETATGNLFGGFTKALQRGDRHAAFEVGALTVVPLICYETMFPSFVEKALPPQAQGRVLVGLSNNGWFGDTLQPYQHVNASILRAVENRVPFVHALNNGPSTVVLPNGRIVFQSPIGEAGGYLVDLPYPSN